MSEEKRILLSSPTMHGEEQQFIKEAFDTNWIAPLGANVDSIMRFQTCQFDSPVIAHITIGKAWTWVYC